MTSGLRSGNTGLRDHGPPCRAGRPERTVAHWRRDLTERAVYAAATSGFENGGRRLQRCCSRRLQVWGGDPDSDVALPPAPTRRPVGHRALRIRCPSASRRRDRAFRMPANRWYQAARRPDAGNPSARRPERPMPCRDRAGGQPWMCGGAVECGGRRGWARGAVTKRPQSGRRLGIAHQRHPGSLGNARGRKCRNNLLKLSIVRSRPSKGR